MAPHRLRFVAALMVYVLWVTSLGVLAVRSASRPVARTGVVAPR